MSAFDRLPEEYLKLCQQIARASGRISPQNRRVRFAADLHLASEKSFPSRDTRQQRRAAERPWKRRATA